MQVSSASLSLDHRNARSYCVHFQGAFYFSFSDDVARASNWSTAVDALVADDRSEFPETTVSWRRFNLLPEVATAVMYRACRSGSILPTLFSSLFLLRIGLNGATEDLAVFAAWVVAGCSTAQFLIVLGVVAVTANRAPLSLCVSEAAEWATTLVPMTLGVLLLVTHLVGTTCVHLHSRVLVGSHTPSVLKVHSVFYEHHSP